MLATGIPVQSLCEHHLLPFTGVAHIGYLPGDRILGLSKLARVLDLFARDLQVQERLTQQVADWLQEQPEPARGRRRDRGRAPVHVAARRAGPRSPHDDIGPARASCGRTLAPARSSSPCPELRG